MRIKSDTTDWLKSVRRDAGIGGLMYTSTQAWNHNWKSHPSWHEETAKAARQVQEEDDGG